MGTSFHPFGDGPQECQRESCAKCRDLEPYHGHLNKVAYWSSNFAAGMCPSDADREAARQWGYLAGLWHDLGKFAPEWQTYLACKADIHTREASGSPQSEKTTPAPVPSSPIPNSLGDLFLTISSPGTTPDWPTLPIF
ncbi:MAG: hypothetical protein R3F31_13715 [Verrucomicrobiales bacterium]